MLLGAKSLDEVIAGLDGISRAAGQNNRIVEQARSARARLAGLSARLAERDAELDGLAAAAEARATSLEATAAERRGLIDELRRQQGLTAARINAIEAPGPDGRDTDHRARSRLAAARALARRGRDADGHRLRRAHAHGQRDRLHDRGRTSTGIPTAPGVVAVDPTVIPLGTRMTIPGYGDGVAADTGGAVHGNTIDLWFPTAAAGARVGPSHGHRSPSTELDFAPAKSEGAALNDTVSIDDTGTQAIRVLLVDDHDLFRTGLRNLLEEQGVDIVAEASSGSEALRFVREAAPDVVVMDLNMPGMSGVEATRHISRDAPLTRVLVLTISDQEQDVMDAILAGACGYLLKDASIQELMQGLEAAAVGESLISPHIAGKVLQHVRATTAAPEAAATIRAELSDREIQVLKLIANGKDNAMIAGELHISPKTVKNHISNILMKLQIENRIQAAVYAVRSGIV